MPPQYGSIKKQASPNPAAVIAAHASFELPSVGTVRDAEAAKICALSVIQIA
jgi:hypothetical protein